MVTPALLPPFQSGRFLIEVGHTVVAAFQEVAGLAVEVEIQEVIEGGHNGFVHKLPGRLKYPNLTLKRGLTADPTFAAWRPALASGKLVVKRQPVTILLLDHAGTTVRTWEVREAYPVKWTGPDLKASSMEVVIESLELAHQGWIES